MARIVFMGTPAFAVPALEALHADNHEILAVFTQPPRPAGRGLTLTRSSVHEAAERLGVPVFTPARFEQQTCSEVATMAPDVVVVVGFGMLLPKQLVDSQICVNVHPSALPRWRGATPVQSAIMAGDTTTDVCIMRLEAGMDTGPVYDRTPVAIGPDMTSGELNDLVWPLGAQRLVEVVRQLPGLVPVPQSGEATRALKITAATRPLDWSRSAAEIHNKVRALAPAPGATAVLEGEVFKVVQTRRVDGRGTPGEIVALDNGGVVVACGEGAVQMVQMQRAGSKAARAADVARGWPALKPGAKLG